MEGTKRRGLKKPTRGGKLGGGEAITRVGESVGEENK